MGKLLSRLLTIVLLVLVIYLYVQVVQLQRANAELASTLKQLSAARAENASLRSQLARHTLGGSKAPLQPPDWIVDARVHVKAAETAVSKGDFALAAKESQAANSDLGNAADEASSQSKSAVLSMRAQLKDVQSKASSLWHQFGG